jgi:P27 family predicted phage terminase small subunit
MKGRKPSVIVASGSAAKRVPPAPGWLSADAKKEWRRIMPTLTKKNILDDPDYGSAENYCVACGRVREIEKLIQKAGGDIDPKLFRMQDKAIMTARQLAAELGLTPVSRSRPAIREESSDNDFADLDL